MLAKLAFRNVRRQFSSYIVYFITVVFTVALLFAANNILFSKEITSFLTQGMESADQTERGIFSSLRQTLMIAIIVITLIVGFIICYATAFLLRKRKKEFGTYLLMGIRRFGVLRIFILENLMIGILSFISGCVVGLGVFKIFDALVVSIVGDGVGHLKLAPDSLWMTAAQWAGIFFVAMLYAGLILQKTKIGGLVNAKTVEKKMPKFPSAEKVFAIVMLFVFIASCAFLVWIVANFTIVPLDQYVSLKYELVLPLAFACFIGSIFGFYFFSRSFYFTRIKNPAKALTGGSVFHYRQMSGALSRNAVLMGAVAVLLAVSFVLTDIAFAYRFAQIESINGWYPFDVYTTVSENDPHTPAEIVAEAQKYSEITFMREYSLYKQSGVKVHEENKEVFDHETGYHEQFHFIKLSDLNALLSSRALPAYTLSDGEFSLLYNPRKPTHYGADGKEIKYTYRIDLLAAGDEVEFLGKTFTFKDTKDEKFLLSVFRNYDYSAFVTVPDNALSAAEWENYLNGTRFVMNTKNYLPPAFTNAFVDGNRYYISCRYTRLDEEKLQSSFFIVSALVLGITFMFMAMALLSLKIMSDADLDKKRYAILNMLGLNESGQRNMLLKQILTFFAAPLLIPLIVAVPAFAVSAIYSFYILGFVPAAVYGIGAVVPLIYAGVYAAYFSATYYLSVKNSIAPLEKPTVKLLTKE